MHKKRGMNLAQASVEYLMVVGIAFVIIVPMVYIFYNYSTQMGEEVTQAKVGRIAGNLADAAEEVFYLGEPSKSTVNFDMPGGVFDAFIPPNSRDVIFYLGDDIKSTEIVAFSNVNLLGYLTPEDLSPGKHSYRVEAKSTYALIYTGDAETARQRWCAYFIARQIEKNAKKVFNDRTDRYVKLFMPVECKLVDVCMACDLPAVCPPALRKVRTTIQVENEGETEEVPFDRIIGVNVQENNDVPCGGPGGTIDVTKAEAFYDFLYTSTNPSVVTISAPSCTDTDDDGYGTVLGTLECGTPGVMDEFDKFDCKDYDDNIILCSGSFICDSDHSTCARCVNPSFTTLEDCDDGVDNNCNDKTDNDDPFCQLP